MKRFAGIATIAFFAHAGVAMAQPVIVSPDEGPRGRMERPPTGGIEPRGLDREAPLRQPDGPSRSQRGAQIEEFRSQGQQRSQELRERGQEVQQRAQEQRTQTEQREQTQRAQEQQRGQDQQRAQEQRMQTQQREQNAREQAQREQQGQRAPTQQNAQSQQPGERSNRPSTAQPSQPQDDRQRATSPTPAPGPGAPQTGTAGRAPAASEPQSAQGRSDNAETQRIADAVRQSVERKEIHPVSTFGVSVSVGAELPSRVQLQPLSREIAAIRPQYRDYRYTVSEHEIVIVDPRSRRIVEVIARDGRGRGPDIYASFEHRRDVRRWSRPDTIVFRQGVILPPSAPYYDLPVEVVERHPDWRGYQYVMTESEEVAIVEPRSRRIVDVVDKGSTQSAAAAPATTGSAAPAAMDDRRDIARMILSDARPGDMQGIDGLKGAVLPDEMVLRPLPREAEERDGGLRGYQYTLIGDDVLIVDPQSRRIIDVIE